MAIHAEVIVEFKIEGISFQYREGINTEHDWAVCSTQVRLCSDLYSMCVYQCVMGSQQNNVPKVPRSRIETFYMFLNENIN
jgi:hypothetical protein